MSGFLPPKQKNFIVTTDFDFKKKSGRKEFLRVKNIKRFKWPNKNKKLSQYWFRCFHINGRNRWINRTSK